MLLKISKHVGLYNFDVDMDLDDNLERLRKKMKAKHGESPGRFKFTLEDDVYNNSITEGDSAIGVFRKA